VPQHWNFSPRILKTFKSIPIRFQTSFLFVVKSGFPKTQDLFPAAPRGVIFQEMTTSFFCFSIILANHQKTSFVDKLVSFVMHCFWATCICFGAPWGPGPHKVAESLLSQKKRDERDRTRRKEQGRRTRRGEQQRTSHEH